MRKKFVKLFASSSIVGISSFLFSPELLAISQTSNLATKQDLAAPYIARYAEQREVYQSFKQAIQENLDNPYSKDNKDKAIELSIPQSLENYPLRPYLEYDLLRASFDNTDIQDLAQNVQAFQTQYKGEYIERRLTATWISYLGKNEHWQTFLSAQDARFKNTTNQCYKLRAQLHLKQSSEQSILQQSKKLWKTGSTLPNACDELIELLDNTQQLADADYWKRFQYAYSQKNDRLAQYLAKSLNNEQQQLANQLLSAQKNPDYWFARLSNPETQPKLTSKAYSRLLKDLAGADHIGVAGLVENYRLPMSEGDWLAIKTLSAWYFAKSNAENALTWINQQSEKETFPLQKKQLRYALQAKDWPLYRDRYENAHKKLKEDNEWQYWYAVALLDGKQSAIRDDLSWSERREVKKAEGILSKLTEKQNFYGLLSAKYFQQELLLSDEINLDDWPVSQPTKDRLATAIELYLTDDYLLATRQWYYSSKGFKRSQWREAAALSHQLGWHERMLRAIASSGFGGAINEQYPLAFAKTYQKQSANTGIDISWLLAMSRQESGFAPLAQSNKGALGVMQLMPATAKRTAKDLKLGYSKEQLKNPEYNITLGSHYLQQLLERFDNNYVLATAAYNAGPHRIDEWLSYRDMGDDWAHWIATIPYKETRKYVQNILAFSHFYQQYLPDELRQDLKLTLFHTPSLEAN